MIDERTVLNIKNVRSVGLHPTYVVQNAMKVVTSYTKTNGVLGGLYLKNMH